MSRPRVALLYHPSHHVPDLAEAEAWFERVFGRPSTRLSSLSERPPRADHSDDYCTFTTIADVLFDTIDPARYVVGGAHPYAPVEEPVLRGLGWYADDIGGLYRELRERGITVLDQLGRVADGPEPPTAAGSPLPLFFTAPDDAGLRYELMPRIPFPLDHRLAPGWTLEPPSPDDPLGIVRCAHHTVLTRDPERALRLVVDVLGGTVAGAGRDELLGATATYVHLADAVIEYAVPDDPRVEPRPGDPHDRYASIAWQVVDLGRAEAHLAAQGVAVAARADGAILTDPATGLGIAWRFTDRPGPGPA